MRFSKQFKTFASWRRGRTKPFSSYKKRIIRLHKLDSKLTLRQLTTAKIRDLELSIKPWKLLSPKERVERNLAFQVLRNMRRGLTLKESIKKVGLSLQTTKKHLGKTIVKKRGRWFAKESDNIQRQVVIFKKEVGKTSIVIKGSKQASLIGEYFSAVNQALKTGDESYLKRFKNKTITDISGKKHQLETNLKRLYEMQDEIEDIEFFEIYED